MAIVTWLRGGPCEPPFRREPQQYSTGAPPTVKLECQASALKIRYANPKFAHQLLLKSRSAIQSASLKPEASPQLLSFQLGSHRNIRFEHL